MKYFVIPQNVNLSVYKKHVYTMGFFAKFITVLDQLLRMDSLSKLKGETYVPYVDWESKPSSLKDETNNEILNEWEYCFSQENKDVVFSSNPEYSDGEFRGEDVPDGIPKPIVGIKPQGKNFRDKIMVSELNKVIKKYIKVKPEILNKLKKEVTDFKTLAVHCRRSEMHLLHDNIALKYENETYFDKVMKIFNEGKFEKIYLSTEEVEIFEFFKSKVPDLLIYQDCYRILRNESPFQASWLGNPRHNHFTLLSQEVLIDVLNMSNCNSLLCGISGVSNGAIYFNGLNYENVYYFDEVNL